MPTVIPPIQVPGRLPGEFVPSSILTSIVSPKLDPTQGLSEVSGARSQFIRQAHELLSELVRRADQCPDFGAAATAHSPGCADSETSTWSQHKDCLMRLQEFTEGIPHADASTIVIGHMNTDLDSIASAIGLAWVIDGVAARSDKEVNGEITEALAFANEADHACLERECAPQQAACTLKDRRKVQIVEISSAMVELPPLVSEVDTGKQQIVLVDHNEPSQIAPSLRVDYASRVVGVVDHHAMSSEFSTRSPIQITMHPVGSTATIVTMRAISLGRLLPPNLARLLFCAVLSDTVNLSAPTTTEVDRLMATFLMFLGGVHDPDAVVKRIFTAKTKYFSNLTAFELVRSDSKVFRFNSWAVSWSAIEVLTDEFIIPSRIAEIIAELRQLKKDRSCHFAFASVTNTTTKTSVALVCGLREGNLLKTVFPDGGFVPIADSSKVPDIVETLENLGVSLVEQYGVRSLLYNLGSRMSRKLEFAPPVNAFLESIKQPGVEDMLPLPEEEPVEIQTKAIFTDIGHSFCRYVLRDASKLAHPLARLPQGTPQIFFLRYCNFVR